MSDADYEARRKKGAEMFGQLYGDALMTPPPRGQDPFFDIMLEQLFAEVWSREAFSVRDRRLVTMGVIAAMGESDVFGIQCGVALTREELTEEQIREMIIHLAQYAGYPRVGGLRAAAEKAIAQHKKKLKTQQETSAE